MLGLEKVLDVAHAVRSIDKTKVDESIATVTSIVMVKDEETLSQLGIKDFDSWNKREKNLFALLIDKNNFTAEIVNAYNENISFANLDRIELFRKINSMKQFLNVSPYNSPSFQEKVYNQVIQWERSDRKDKTNLLLDGFRCYTDINTLTDYLSSDTNRSESATNIIDAKRVINKKAIETKIYGVGTATIAALLITTKTFSSIVNLDVSQKIIDNVHSYLGDSLLIGTLALGVVGAVAAFKSYKLLHKGFIKIADLEINKNIRSDMAHIGSKEMTKFDDNFSKKYISSMLLDKVCRKNEWDSSIKENKKYLSMLAFLNEKIYQSDLQVPQKMINDYQLNKNEVNRLNSFTIADIHEIASLHSDRARMLLISHDLNYREKYTVKNLDSIEILTDKKEIENEFINQIPQNITVSIKQKILTTKGMEKELINYYLKVNTDENAQCKTVNALENALRRNNGKGINFYNESKVEMQDKLRNFNNKEKTYVSSAIKKVWEFLKGNDKLTTKTRKILVSLEDISKKYDLTYTQEKIESETPYIHKGIEGVEKIMSKVKSMRGKTSMDRKITHN